MSKRAGQFERRPQDAYDTPASAVRPLIPHLPRACYFVEPAAGRGDLVDHLEKFGHTCIAKFDIEPRRSDIERRSAFSNFKVQPGVMIITNPVWDRSVLHPMIRHFASIAPTWLLFDSDWLFTKQASDLLPICHKSVAVGRVRWIEGTGMDGKDNSSWQFFDASYQSDFVKFYGR